LGPRKKKKRVISLSGNARRLSGKILQLTAADGKQVDIFLEGRKRTSEEKFKGRSRGDKDRRRIENGGAWRENGGEKRDKRGCFWGKETRGGQGLEYLFE